MTFLWQSGMALTPARMNRLLVARKTVDESVANNATLQDDDQLQIQAAANSAYRLRLFAIHNTPVSPTNLRIGMAGPSGVQFGRLKYEAGPNASLQVGVLAAGSAPTTGGVTGTAADAPLEIIGTVTTTTAGLIKFQWSQSGANATAAIVRAGSYLELALID